MPELLHFPGTRRTREPEQTLDLITPRLAEFGVTRLADVTGLDVIGIPVVMSVRPLSMTLSVSQGKGVTLPLAKVSAAMESIELWHAENRVPAAETTTAAARDLELPYDATALEQHHRSLLTDRTRLGWITAENLRDGGTTLVPRDSVQLGEIPAHWRTDDLVSGSNGLASGNTVDEATVHAVYELIERDCTAGLVDLPAAHRVVVASKSVDDPHCADLIDRVHHADGWLELVDAGSPRWPGIACYSCYLWLPDTGLITCGSGAHRDPRIALSRAITEAVQSRLTVIAGTRDDLDERAYREEADTAPARLGTETTWPDLEPMTADTDSGELAGLVALLASATGAPSMRVVLTPPEETDFAVVRVVCPDMAFTARHDLPRPE